MRTRWARDSAWVFSMTWARWVLTVSSLMPNSIGNLLVQQARDDQVQHFFLARRERIEPRTNFASSARSLRRPRSLAIAF